MTSKAIEAIKAALKEASLSIPDRGAGGCVEKLRFALDPMAVEPPKLDSYTEGYEDGAGGRPNKLIEGSVSPLHRLPKPVESSEHECHIYRRGCPECENGQFDIIINGIGFCKSCGGVAIISIDPKPVEPCEDAMQFAIELLEQPVPIDNGIEIIRYENITTKQAAALITADREKLLRDAADRTCDICPCGKICDRRADGCKYKAAILGREREIVARTLEEAER